MAGKDTGWEEVDIPAPKVVDGVWEETSAAPIRQAPQPSALGVGEAAAAAAAIPQAGWEAKKALFKKAAPALSEGVTTPDSMQRYLNSQIAARGVKGTIPLEKFASATGIPSDTISQSAIQDALRQIKPEASQRVATPTPSGGRIFSAPTPAKPPLDLSALAEQSMLERAAPKTAAFLKPAMGPLSTIAKHAAPPLAIGATAGELQDMYNRGMADPVGAGISALGAAGSAASAMPFLPPPARIVGGAVGAAAPLANMGIDKMRAHLKANMKPQELEAVRKALPFNLAKGGIVPPHIEHAQKMAKGGSVLPKGQHMPSGAKVDLAKRQRELEQGGPQQVFKSAAKETYDNPIINNALAALPVTGEAMLAGDVADQWQKGNKLTAAGMGLAGMLPFGGMIGKTVWHGSPHLFNKFDLSKLGTGEGAQRYGHGLYLAESPEVARGYKERLSNSDATKFNFGGKEVGYMGDAKKDFLDQATNKGFSKESALLALNELQDSGGDLTKASGNLNWLDEPNKYQQEAGKILENLDFISKGHLYKVDLPDEHIAKMVNWDEPFAKQKAHEILKAHPSYPDVKAAMTKEMKLYGLSPEDYSGAHFMRMMDEQHNMFSNPAQRTSMVLQEAGIPGVQYLDMGSRMKGDGTRNYVSFSDEIPQILERNGQPLDNLK